MTPKIAIVGATSAIAVHCARLWVERGAVDLTLVGRDADALARDAADLRVRSPASAVRTLVADFLDPAAIAAAVDAVVRHGPPDIVLIAHGALPDQARCQTDLAACRDALEINAISPVLYAEAFASHLAAQGRGTLALIGSVAGDRGRRSNYVYGAAKGLLERYAQGLRHRFAPTAVRVVLIKPGPTDTPMTAHLKARGLRLAPVERVARDVVDGIERGRAVVYTPGLWRPIMLVVRHLPDIVFRRLNV